MSSGISNRRIFFSEGTVIEEATRTFTFYEMEGDFKSGEGNL